MKGKVGYHRFMKRVVVAVFGALCAVLLLPPMAAAQINGVPSSVTSIGFGGHAGPQGVPPSVTSIGPRGLVPNNSQVPFTGGCCINPLFSSQPHPVNNGHHHHNHQPFFGGYSYAVPYAIPYYAEDSGSDVADEPYNGGPTVFDRRGNGQPAPYQASPYAEAPVASQPAPSSDETASDQPQTVLVFKDGHQIEVSNYAIVGSTLYDLTPGHSRRVTLTELDLSATAQQNDNRGIDFQVPGAAGAAN